MLHDKVLKIVKEVTDRHGDAFMLTVLGVTGLKAVKQLMKTAKGKTTRRRRRRSYRRSLGDDEFLGGNFEKIKFLGNIAPQRTQS